MRKQILFSTIALFASAASLSAQSVMSVQVSENADKTRVYADIKMDSDGGINTMNLDLKYPASLTVNKSAFATGGLCQEYDEDEGVYTPTWNLSSSNYAEYSFIRLVAYGQTGKRIEAGQSGKLIRVTFDKTDPSAEYTASDFLFNNVSGALGGVIEEMKAPVCILGTNGYSSFSTSEDVIIEGATANYGTISGSTLTLNPVAEGEPIFHGEGVILKGTEGTTVYATSVATATRPTSNDVIATGNGVEVAPNSVHVLSTEGGVTGFYLYTGTKIGAGKAYLTAPAGARIVIEEETGIDTLTEESAPAAIFNLQGQKMQEAKKGIQIVNGKKVMF